MLMRAARVLVFAIGWLAMVGCASPAPSVDAGSTGTGSNDGAASNTDAVVAHDDAAASSSCRLADGHPCVRWARTEPDGDDICLGYDGLGAICSNDPTSGSCDVGGGHSCTRWLRTDPHGEWACLGYDGLGVICGNDPTSGSCNVGGGHSCSRWARTEPHGEWACLGYDGLGIVCQH